MTTISLFETDGSLETKIATMSKADAMRAFDLLKDGCFNMEHSLAEEIRAGVLKFGVVTWEELGIKDSDVDTMVKASKQKYAFHLLERMKTATSETSAQNDAGEIRRTINDGYIIWKKLRATNDFLDELIAEAAAREVLDELDNLQTKCPHWAADSAADNILQGVKNNKITWGRLKIIETDLPVLAHEAKVRDFKEKLQVVKSADSEHAALDYADCLRKAVKHKLVTWKELGTTDNQLKKLTKEAAIRKVVELLEKIENNRWYTIDQNADPIRKAVTNKVVTWKRLGITHKDFETLVHAIKVREYRAMVKIERQTQSEGKFSVNHSYIRQAIERGDVTGEEIETTEEEISSWEKNTK